MARRRRNAPLTAAQESALRSILSAHTGSAAATNPKRRAKRRAVKRTAKRRHGKKRRISASLRRKLLANLRKARRARWGRKSRR
jgi:hypothetical protein